MTPEIEMIGMDSAGMRMLQRQAFEYLKMAGRLLKKNKDVDIDILNCECGVSLIDESKTLVRVLYSADGHEVRLHILDKVFKDDTLKSDAAIGVKPDMSLKTKILLRTAHLLYGHRND